MKCVFSQKTNLRGNTNLNKAQEVAKGGDVHYLLDSKWFYELKGK